MKFYHVLILQNMSEAQQMVLIMELADGSVRDELKKLENMFGLSYQILLQLIDHLGILFASFTLHYLNFLCFILLPYFPPFYFTAFCFILCDTKLLLHLYSLICLFWFTLPCPLIAYYIHFASLRFILPCLKISSL